MTSSLLLWKDLPSDGKLLEQADPAQTHPNALRENVERLAMGGLARSSFAQIVSGLQAPQTIQHDVDLLGRIVALASPGASIQIVQAVKSGYDPIESPLITTDRLISNIKLAGFVNVAEPQAIQTDHKAEIAQALQLIGDFQVVSVKCEAPAFEVGSSRLLSFAKNVAPMPVSPAVNAVWSLGNLDDDDVDLIDSDQLLDESDWAKPSAESLRVCGTTGKRKACKDCSCGLKEEIEEGKTPTKKTVTSSCGSCYLGDAFRCASCPYLGMPAFKPGEKIALSKRQLNADA
ncbi:anamorsin homolog [Tigriopus californicus]|uniref:anamorsin homolog n=1 Tax=Tigriopus californicus TaxID=6832 RepID=UPI0027D9EB64|nr:anamorsin homolog [Tigriopus californicus]